MRAFLGSRTKIGRVPLYYGVSARVPKNRLAFWFIVCFVVGFFIVPFILMEFIR